MEWRGRIPIECWDVVDDSGNFKASMLDFVLNKGAVLVGDDVMSRPFWARQAGILAEYFKVVGLDIFAGLVVAIVRLQANELPIVFSF